MKFIKNKNFLRNVVAVFIMLCIIAGIIVGTIYYMNAYKTDMQNELTRVVTEKNLLIETLNEDIRGLKASLTTNEAELADIKETLEQVKADAAEKSEKIEKQTKTIEKYEKTIKNHEKTIEEQKKELKKYKKTTSTKKSTTSSKKPASSTKNTSTSTKKYAVATEAWKSMKKLGWSDTVCAGIIGNFMAETGGGTLMLDWDSSTSSCYGLVQWTGGRRSAIKKKYGKYPTVKQQIQFIHDELYGTNGVRRQVTSSQLKKIMNAKTPEECAYAFASYYERCATQYRSIRKSYARKAYNYFT